MLNYTAIAQNPLFPVALDLLAQTGCVTIHTEDGTRRKAYNEEELVDNWDFLIDCFDTEITLVTASL